MRFLDNDNEKALKNVTLYLTQDEAKELLYDLQDNLNNYDGNYHSHIDDENFDHELSLVVYDQKNIDSFDERSKELILNDK